MQNIDFSKKIQSDFTAQATRGRKSGAETSAEQVSKSNKMPKAWTYILMAVSIAYGSGVYSGLRIQSVSQIENNLIKYPDEPKTETASVDTEDSSVRSSFSNVPLDADPGTGNYILFIGTFEPEAAALIANKINNHSDLASFRPMSCAKIKESVPGRYPAFRTRSRDEALKQDVYVGCFPGESAAAEVLGVIKDAGIRGAESARIFSIE
jgi:hypothetical protein